jgi:hypothetical protein
MDTLICAGGSGSRVLEAVVHLCAAGLGPPKLRAFVIDPDATNGSLEKTRLLVEHYRALHDIFGRGQPAEAGDFFATEFDLLLPEGGLQRWSPVKDGQEFSKVLNYETLNKDQKEIVHLFFTQNELEMKMNVGFRGHPALGAAALSLLPLFQNTADVPLWNAFHAALKNDVTKKSNVIVVGSVFGGTGASAIHPIVRYLRSSGLPENNAANLKVGAVALVPYFQFVPDLNNPGLTKKDIEEAAHSEQFPLASRSAAEYYEHLRATEDWDFDAMYWIGDDYLTDVKYSLGGKTQANPAHFVDLLAALACFDFFSNAPHTDVQPKSQDAADESARPRPADTMAPKQCWYCGPEVAQGAKQNSLAWEDLPIRSKMFGYDREELRKRLHTFQMAAVAHLSFNARLLSDKRLPERPYLVPWYVERFTKETDNLCGGENAAHLQKLSDYWQKEYLPWWQQINATNPRVQLFNSAAWGTTPPDLMRLGNLLYPDEAHHDLETVDELFASMVSVARNEGGVADGQKPARRYLRLLASASRPIVKRIQETKPSE